MCTLFIPSSKMIENRGLRIGRFIDYILITIAIIIIIIIIAITKMVKFNHLWLYYHILLSA